MQGTWELNLCPVFRSTLDPVFRQLLSKSLSQRNSPGNWEDTSKAITHQAV